MPLACGGPDAVSNLEWQTIPEPKGKDTQGAPRVRPQGEPTFRPVAAAAGGDEPIPPDRELPVSATKSRGHFGRQGDEPRRWRCPVLR